jgi:hypothetical protein
MNEKIKDLAEQAGLHDFVLIAMGIDEEVQKFAELIVKECIDVLDKAVYLATREDGEQEYIDVVLLEHFEIEE